VSYKLERIPFSWERRNLGRLPYLYPVRWEWESFFSSYGLAYGYALSKRGASKCLLEAERELLLS
jgi:hypothetical protein